MHFKKLLIWGKGGHSKVIQDCLKGWRIELIDNLTKYSDNDNWLLDVYPPRKYEIFVAIGDNNIREKNILRLINLGYNTPNIVSSKAFVSKHSQLDRSIFVAPGACVNTDTYIKQGSIINTGATVDHDCNIGYYTHIAPGCHICGGVIIGNNTLIGVGSSIIPKIKIGNNIIVAGGSSINKNLENNALYAGVPAQFKKWI